MRRLLLVVVALCALALAPAATAARADETTPAGSWADSQIQAVVAAGLMAPSAADFRPQDPLTKGELTELLAGLNAPGAPPADPAQAVTVADLNAALVRALGLTAQAKAFRKGLVAAGLNPPKRAGTEIVAHLLGLRLNHSPESLELLPTEAVTRAEAAYSVAKVLTLSKPGSWQLASVKEQAAAFSLPGLSGWQRRVLTRAVSFLGFPYVWAGVSEKPQVLSTASVPGGFDCSGFVWRIFKLEPFADAPQLAAVLKGRTTYVMSAEVPPAQRLGRDVLAPADLVFFGDSGPASKPAEIGHMGIYLGNGWFIHSSSGGAGVMVSQLTGWYGDRFAWGRRPLAEAGLDAAEPSAPAEPAPAPSEPATPPAGESPGGNTDGETPPAVDDPNGEIDPVTGLPVHPVQVIR